MESKNRKNNLMKASGKFYPASAGEKLEAMSVELFEEEYGINAVKYNVGSSKDLYEGNDLELFRIPLDITMNPNKDHTEWSKKITRIPFMGFNGIAIKWGVRTGNSHKGFTRFETPVLVMQVDGIPSNQFFFNYMVNIKSAIKKNLREIVDNGMDFYYNFMDEHPEYNF